MKDLVLEETLFLVENLVLGEGPCKDLVLVLVRDLVLVLVRDLVLVLVRDLVLVLVRDIVLVARPCSCC